ncbi:MAG: phosphotransferase [Sphingobium sp.]
MPDATVAPIAIPADVDGLTLAFLTQVVRTVHPGVTVTDFELVERKRYGEPMVSTSDRLRMRLDYAPGAPDDLPRQVAVKMKRSSDAILGELYQNEVDFYVRLRPGLDIEAPAIVGGVCDKDSALYYLLLEDLSLRGAIFPSAIRDNSLDEVRAVLDQMARLHATFWNSPRLATDLAWYQSHVAGSLHDRMDRSLPITIGGDLPVNPFKRELVESLGTDVGALHTLYRALQRQQATGPQTILHGDGHIANSYLLPGGRAGLLDWQLTARGSWAHDVNYLIVTALDVETRRVEERALVDHYLDRLHAQGVTDVPDRETAWLEYRRALLWSLYVGWLTTPIANYGEAINRANLTRTGTAVRDHDTLALVRDLG